MGQLVQQPRRKFPPRLLFVSIFKFLNVYQVEKVTGLFTSIAAAGGRLVNLTSLLQQSEL